MDKALVITRLDIDFILTKIGYSDFDITVNDQIHGSLPDKSNVILGRLFYDLHTKYLKKAFAKVPF